MNTKDIANKWRTMCTEGKNLDCINEIYDEDIVSKEMVGVPYGEITKGKQDVWNKAKQWLENIEEFHSSEISEPVIAGNHFTTKMSFDVTFKDRGRQQMDEICVFEVNNGKIIHEQFFYSM